MNTGAPYRYNHIQVEITSRCNLRCRTCLYFYFEPQWVPEDLSETAFRQLCGVAPACRSIHLQGWGESLLRNDCTALIRRLAKEGTKVSVGTNGTIMNPDVAGALIRSGLDSMTFSIAGASADQQDPLRGRGSFDRAMQAVRIFSEARGDGRKPPIVVNYLLTPDSLKSLHRAIILCSRLGVDILHPTRMVHIATRFQEILADCHPTFVDRWAVFRARLAVLWSGVTLTMPSLKKNLVPVCEKNPIENLFVGADGSVSPCVYLNPPLNGSYPRIFGGQQWPSSRLVMGNLNRNRLDDIWNRQRYKQFRKAFGDRLQIYQQLMKGITPDFEGMERLQKTSDRLASLFTTRHQAPGPCRICPHLQGL